MSGRTEGISVVVGWKAAVIDGIIGLFGLSLAWISITCTSLIGMIST